MVTTSAPARVTPWRALRFWLALAVVAVLGAVVLGALSDAPARPLDPASPGEDGSLALARLIEADGIPVTRTTSLGTAVGADTAVLVTEPDAYSERQLQRLTSVTRVVLVAPEEPTLLAALPGATVADSDDVSDGPGCALAGARAAGGVTWPDATIAYAAPTSCYGGAVAAAAGPRPTVVVLGSNAPLRNDRLARRGSAALAINLLTADRTVSRVVWLFPGADAAGSGPASVWDVFPDGARRVFWWLLAVGVALAVWRARRLGGVVAEPLPVVVRAAELVEGHGRLYERAGAREHAAVPLRAAATRRLTERVALPRGSTAEHVAAVVAPLVARSHPDVAALLAGPPPGDDAGLVRLARELDRLDAAVSDALTEGRS